MKIALALSFSFSAGVGLMTAIHEYYQLFQVLNP